jgi:hypothetical protein
MHGVPRIARRECARECAVVDALGARDMTSHEARRGGGESRVFVRAREAEARGGAVWRAEAIDRAREKWINQQGGSDGTSGCF